MRNYWLVSHASVLGKVMKQILLEPVSKHKEDKKVVESNQHEFMKGKLCLSSLALVQQNDWFGRRGKSHRCLARLLTPPFTTISQIS